VQGLNYTLSGSKLIGGLNWWKLSLGAQLGLNWKDQNFKRPQFNFYQVNWLKLGAKHKTWGTNFEARKNYFAYK
jgi:hypothetical protein